MFSLLQMLSIDLCCSCLQRASLGMLNYLRSVERTLTFDLAGLQLEEGELCRTAEETGWMNAARGGRGEAGGLSSLQHAHNTPVDYKVQIFRFKLDCSTI